ncbi:hypothetical protein SAMN04487965_3134 [Microbulbifer donghaiensis]|uniref:Uncharacterized protein n=1 Tax=Microbulbifer donghaiensis TaxID=494016 RepID=A0A1M5GA71_9GAMM|nr:hypothetical protein [Microbulbifer donghaiensis]SHG00667.1 hypothetical protein SAMN04487965_3134 [Microbulbifer donghaiensis]
MNTFEHLSITFILILVLGVTRIVSDVAGAFLRRHISRLHWVPLTWALLVLVWLVQTIWAIYGLREFEAAWDIVDFAIQLLGVLFLFAAACTVVPRAHDHDLGLFELFQRDGRWALLFLALFFLLAVVINHRLYGVDYWYIGNLEDMVLAVILLIILCSRSRSNWALGTWLFIVATLVAMLILTPAQLR